MLYHSSRPLKVLVLMMKLHILSKSSIVHSGTYGTDPPLLLGIVINTMDCPSWAMAMMLYLDGARDLHGQSATGSQRHIHHSDRSDRVSIVSRA